MSEKCKYTEPKTAAQCAQEAEENGYCKLHVEKRGSEVKEEVALEPVDKASDLDDTPVPEED